MALLLRFLPAFIFKMMAFESFKPAKFSNKSRSQFLLIRVRSLPLLGAALIAACSAGSPAFVPVQVEASVSADKKVNPDRHGRASPVLVRVYELKDGANFLGADFLSLYERDQATLGSDMIHREEYLLKPGESKVWSRKADVEARVLAVFVAYRELERSVWRAVEPVPAAKEAESIWGKGALKVFSEPPSAHYSISVGEHKVQIGSVNTR